MRKKTAAPKASARRMRQPLQTRGVDSFYSLDTSLLHYPHTGESQATDKYDIADFQRLYLHELTHWYQHHGTSVGAFISSVKSALNLHCAFLLGTLTPENRRELAKRRAGGHPILPLFVGNAPNRALFEDETIPAKNAFSRLTSRHAYYYLSNCDFFFRCYSLVASHSYPGAVVADALFYVENFLAARGVGKGRTNAFESCTQKWNAQFEPLAFNNPAWVSANWTPIDTQDLFESCAILMEAIYFLYSFQYGAIDPKQRVTNEGTHIANGFAAVARVHGLNDEYASPIYYASLIFHEPMAVTFHEDDKHHEGNWDFFTANAPTLIAAIEIALNPPLPPNSTDTEKFAWAQIYPPLRYARCVAAVKKVGKLKINANASRDKILDYMQQMADAAQVPYDLPVHRDDTQDLFSDCMDTLMSSRDSDNPDEYPKAATHLRTKFDQFDFTRSCQRMFTRIQSQHRDGMLIDLMLDCIRGNPPHYARSPKAFEGTLGRGLVPPVIIDTSAENLRIVPGLWPKEMASWLVFHGAAEYHLFDLLDSTGRVRFDAKLSDSEQLAIDGKLKDLFGRLPW